MPGTLNTGPAAPRTGVSLMMKAHTATRVTKVLAFPMKLAAITVPLEATIMRRPLTRNSRATTTSGIQLGRVPSCTSTSMAA